MDWVFDASMALALVLPDEHSERADRFLEHLTKSGKLWVPALWWYEVSNGLAMARRRKRLSGSDFLRAVGLLEQLPVFVDPLLGGDAIRRFSILTERYALSAYDAAYLELATRKNVGLATLDEPLARIARKGGVTVPT